MFNLNMETQAPAYACNGNGKDLTPPTSNSLTAKRDN
jgi:hypothetical protein